MQVNDPEHKYCLMYYYLRTTDETEVPPRTASPQVRILEFFRVYLSQPLPRCRRVREVFLRENKLHKNHSGAILYLVRQLAS